MEFRIFPQPKKDDAPAPRPPTFGKRRSLPEVGSLGSKQAVKATALCVGAVVLAVLVLEPF
ncbi:hypothetical protein [Methylopila sp. M107]|uniref:hypothetical protein n=1 Tax=Methylopila sp. M107 TaxID=1101190 RepID=UPI0003743212|nr:hypothetical protein [Methylopila sp. M107]